VIAFEIRGGVLGTNISMKHESGRYDDLPYKESKENAQRKCQE